MELEKFRTGKGMYRYIIISVLSWKFARGAYRTPFVNNLNIYACNDNVYGGCEYDTVKYRTMCAFADFNVSTRDCFELIAFKNFFDSPAVAYLWGGVKGA